MVQAARRLPNSSDRMKKQDDNITDLYSLMRIRHSPVQRISIPNFGTGSSAPKFGGNFLKTEGDTMVGPIAFFPDATTVASGAIDIGKTSGNFTSYIIVLGEGATDDSLDTITGAAFSGQICYMQATSTTAITLTNLGNIITSDGADLLVPAGNVATLIFDPTVAGGGKWRVTAVSSGGGGGGGSGANTALSNLSNPTAINQNLLPNALGTLDLGSGAVPWNNIFVEQIRLQAGAVSPSNAPLITEVSNNMILNVNTGQEIQLYWNGTQKHDFSETLLTVLNLTVGDGTADVGTVTLNDLTAKVGPANGMMYREGTDVKVFSGGAERNLSSIGAAGGANVTLSNLSAGAVAVNTDLDPDTPATHDLGDGTNDWQNLFVNNVRLQTGGIGVGGANQIYADLGGTVINFPTSTLLTLQENAVDKWSFSASTMTGSNIILSNTFTLNDSVTDPAANGQFTRNGTEVKVQANGTVFTLSDIGNHATKALDNLASVAINTSLLPDTGSTHDLGSGTFDWANLFVDDVRLQAGGTGVGGARQIYGDVGGVVLNTPTATTYSLDFNNVAVWGISSTSFTGPNIILSNTLTLNDNLANPSANGQFARNGNDVFVFTGGVLKNLSNIGTGGGASLPLSVDELEHGNVTGNVTIDLSLTTAHYHTMTLIGDVDFTFTNPPASNKVIQFTLDITQDSPTGNHSISFNDTLDTSAITVKQAAGARTVIIVMTRDGGTTYSTFGSALTPTVTDVGNKWSDPVNSSLIPNSNNVYDLGSSGAQFKDLWIDGTANIDLLKVDAAVGSTLIPQTDDLYDLGISGNEWRDLWIDGTAHLDTIISGDITMAANVVSMNNAVTPSTPSVGTRKIFVDSGTGELSVLTSAGSTVSLEASGGSGDNWGDPVDAHIIPLTTNTYDLGSTSNRFRNIWATGQATLGSLNVAGTIITGAGTLQMNQKNITQTGDISADNSGKIIGTGVIPYTTVFTNKIQLNTGATQTEAIDVLGSVMNFRVPTGESFAWKVNGFDQLTVDTNEVNLQNNDLIFNTSQGQEITSSGAGLTYNAGTGNSHFFSNGSNIMMRINGTTAVEIDGGKYIRSDSSSEIGYIVSNSSLTVGIAGTVQIPFVVGSATSAAQATTDFGNVTGAMGVYLSSGGTPVLVIRRADGDWATLLMDLAKLT